VYSESDAAASAASSLLALRLPDAIEHL